MERRNGTHLRCQVVIFKGTYVKVERTGREESNIKELFLGQDRIKLRGVYYKRVRTSNYTVLFYV